MTARLHHWEGPQQRRDLPTVVLVHGVGLDHAMWVPVAELLAKDRHVVAYDLLGHGETEDPPGPRRLDDFVDQLMAVLDAIAEPSVDVVGSSLGALIALHAAGTNCHRIRSLVLANMVFGRTESERAAVGERLRVAEEAGMASIADLAIDRWFRPAWQQANSVETTLIRQRLTTTDLGAYLKAYRVFVETDATISGATELATMPTLVITGELDPGSTPAMTRALGVALPSATTSIMEGLHHLPAIEAPAAFAAELVDFFNAQPSMTKTGEAT